MKTYRIYSRILLFISVCSFFFMMLTNSVVEAKDLSNNKTWNFMYFGTSTSGDVNKLIEGSSIKSEVSMTSCSVNSDGSIKQKGGKFVATDGYDGVSYYYTKIDPNKENFYLKADVTVDYINPSPDGQEGFAIIARDSIGINGESEKPFYSNSMATIATKLDYIVDNKKISTVKDGIGYRIFTGLKSPDETPVRGSFNVESSALDKNDVVKPGETYQLILKRDNTGYHMIYIDKNGTKHEKIYYFDGNQDPLTIADKNNIYVGFAVSRGCNATFKNIEFKVTDKKTDPPAKEHPDSYIDPVFKIVSAKTTGLSKYDLIANTNIDGTMKVIVNNKIQANVNIKSGQDIVQTINLNNGNNNVEAIFYPKKEAFVKPFTKLKSYEPVTLKENIIKKSFEQKNIYVSPTAQATGKGTIESPTDLITAINYAVPGQNIYLEPGKYYYSNISIVRGINGTKDKMITLESDPNKKGRAIFDFQKKGTGFELWGNYWHLKNIDVTNTSDYNPGLQVCGNHNIVELVNTYDNGNSGLQIGGMTSETIDKWPSYNLILNCNSYNNADKAMEDADGFAAKITCGVGNVFDGCMSYYNADDGWDLFAKVAAGNIGAVTIKNCLAYRNGYIIKDGNVIKAGNGNGFKMGGSGLSGHHVLINSISYENKGNGIDSNFCPDIEVYNSTSYNNEKANVAFYSNKDIPTGFKADGIISIKDKYMDKADVFQLVKQNKNVIYKDNNYIFNGKQTQNMLGKFYSKDIFINLDTDLVPTRNEDGTINMHGLLILNDKAPANAGARWECPTR